MSSFAPSDSIRHDALALAVAGTPLAASVVRPMRSGPSPVVLLCIESTIGRSGGSEFARSLACRGYYVLVRVLGEGGTVCSRTSSGSGRDDVRQVARETAAIIRHLDGDPMAMATEIGAIGFGVGAAYALCAAAQEPARIKAVAAIDGPSLVTDHEDSPHRLVHLVAGEMYFGFSKRSELLDGDEMGRLAKALEDCNAPYRVDSGENLAPDVLAEEAAVIDGGRARQCQSTRLLDLLCRRLPLPEACAAGFALTTS